MIGPDAVTVARAGWFDRRMVPASPPDASWRTDGPGSFSCEMDARYLGRCGLLPVGRTNPLKGRWLWWNHPTAGPWAGVITRTDVDGWYVRVMAEQFNVLLRKRRLAATFGAVAMAPGSLALALISAAERYGESYMLTGAVAEETGQAVDLDPRGGDLCDEILPMLARYGYQWRVKASTMDERLFEFRTRLGEDKRGRVLLVEGYHVSRPTVSGDLWTVANSIVGVSGDRTWADASGYQQDDLRSIRTLGRRFEETIAYNGVATRSTIAPLVKRDLADLRYPKEVADLELVDANMCWSDVREGDIVGVALESANVRAPLLIDIRSLRATDSTMRIAGRFLIEEAA